MKAGKGARFLTLRPLRCHVGISWAAPYSTGHQAVVPAGELVEVAAELLEEHGVATVHPVRYKELEPWLVGTADPAMRKYQGYELLVDPAQLAACSRAAEPGETPRPDYESPVAREVEDVRVTGIGVLTPDRRYFLEGIEAASVREHRGSRKLAGYLLVVGIILLTAIVGIAFIAGAIAVHRYRRHDVVIRYAGEEVRLGRFADRSVAEALADAIASRLPTPAAGVG